MRLLVVEDDTTLGGLIVSLLSEEGHDVIFTTTLRAAIHILAPGRFDVVVLDLLLGDSRSLDTLAAVRRHDPYVPIIVTTGMDVSERDVLAGGAKELVVKGEPGFTTRLREALARAFASAVFTPVKEKLDKVDRLAQQIKEGNQNEPPPPSRL